MASATFIYQTKKAMHGQIHHSSTDTQDVNIQKQAWWFLILFPIQLDVKPK